MSVIGEQIKKYRVQKKYTQEKLGSMIGVTTQAVSKWERGGTPDAEVLPQLADALGVSIDALFGRESQDEQMLLIKKLNAMPSDEAFRQAFSCCWSFIPGLTGEESFSENFYEAFSGHSDQQSDQSSYILAKLLRDDGLVIARISNDLRYFFLLVRPHDDSILAHFEHEDAIRQVFALLADKKILKTIYYLYTASNIPVTAALISQGTGLELSDVERCMKTLCDKKIVHPMKIASVDGEINSYIIRSEANVLPLLCYADEIAKGCQYPIFGMCDRDKPIF
ncbi:MAG: helix-turn-helix transcriptional regulator [Ruminococcus sp.]|nr:helix-turn-helix transcriptional regulator [Ruminococcus sp.]